MLLNVVTRLAEVALSVEEIDSVFTSNVGWDYSVFSILFLNADHIVCLDHFVDVLRFKLV